MAAASSSTTFFGRDDNQQPILLQHSSSTTTSSSAAPPPKKKRNQPGQPNPDAEVIALSPKTLMATNRFICEVCNKGFQREQNLQLHRRGHNLPWKLKQKTNKEVKRKVYLCPEPTCVHHDPSRALGDLTGIKKHYSRKHGEKKWKCDKCSKRYAVQSDWKAHSKTCGTREYRCDCGTLFSRRDSFITHRAFCDALAQETARHPTSLSTFPTHLFTNNTTSTNTMTFNLSQRQPQPKFDPIIPPSSSSSTFFIPDHQTYNQDPSFSSNKHLQGLMKLPDLQTNPSPNLFNLGFFPNNASSTDQQFTSNGIFDGFSSLYNVQQENNISSHMSATALLQKAAQIGSTTTTTQPFDGNFGDQNVNENNNNLQGLMNSLANGGYQINGPDKLTLDFLGVGGMVRNINNGGFPQREHHHQGVNIGATLDGQEMKLTQAFGSGKLQ